MSSPSPWDEAEKGVDLSKIDWSAKDGADLFINNDNNSSDKNKRRSEAQNDLFNPSGGLFDGNDGNGNKDDEDSFSKVANDFFLFDPSEVRRAETAPMVLTLMQPGRNNGMDGTEPQVEEAIDPAEEYRYSPEYHQLYYSQTPRDPRMLPPLTRRVPLAVIREELAYRMNHMTAGDPNSRATALSNQNLQTHGVRDAGNNSITGMNSNPTKSSTGSEINQTPMGNPLPLQAVNSNGTVDQNSISGAAPGMQQVNGAPPPVVYQNVYYHPGQVQPGAQPMMFMRAPAGYAPQYAYPFPQPPQGAPMYYGNAQPPPQNYPGAYAYPPNGQMPPPQQQQQQQPPQQLPQQQQQTEQQQQQHIQNVAQSIRQDVNNKNRTNAPPNNAANNKLPNAGANSVNTSVDAQSMNNNHAGQKLPTGGKSPIPAAPLAKPSDMTLDEIRILLKDHLEQGKPGWSYKYIEGRVVDLAKEDQDSSRQVQRLLFNPAYIHRLMSELLPETNELIKNIFANYVMQRAFEVALMVRKAVQECEESPSKLSKLLGFSAPMTEALLAELKEDDWLEQLLSRVRGQVRQLSLHMYGCRVIQKAVEGMDNDDFDAALEDFKGKVVESVFDQSANHVVQKLIEVHPERCGCFYDEFLENLVELSCDSHGCRILQRTFEVSKSRPDVDLSKIYEAVIQRISELAIHQYGNYVIQHSMLNAPDEYRHRFIKILIPQIYPFSCSKFASNVAEKTIIASDENEKDAILTQLCKPFGDPTGSNYVVHMMSDIYANYVVQRLLEYVSQEQAQRLTETLRPHLRTVCQSDYGRHLVRRIEAMKLLAPEDLIGCGLTDDAARAGGAAEKGHGKQNHRNNNNNNNNNNMNHNHNNHMNHHNQHQNVGNPPQRYPPPQQSPVPPPPPAMNYGSPQGYYPPPPPPQPQYYASNPYGGGMHMPPPPPPQQQYMYAPQRPMPPQGYAYAPYMPPPPGNGEAYYYPQQ